MSRIPALILGSIVLMVVFAGTASAHIPISAFHSILAEANEAEDANTEAASSKMALWPIEEELVEYTNKVRAQHGLPALEMDESLIKSARSHAWWMVRNSSLQHTSAPVAENIAMGQHTASEVVRDWMNSPGHRANMLGNYRRIGAAAYQTKGGTAYWCLQFLR